MKSIIIAVIVVVVMGVLLSFTSSDPVSYVKEATEVVREEEVVEIDPVEEARLQLEEANRKLDEQEAKIKAEREAAQLEWEAKEQEYKDRLEEIKNLRVSFTQAPKQDN